MSSDTLSKQIAKDVLKEQQLPKDINRAAFLALREEIIVAINDGWKIIQIWKTLHNQGRISFTYPTFTIYVNKLIFNKNQKPIASITDIQSQTNTLLPQENINIPTPNIDSQSPISIVSCLDWPSPTSWSLALCENITVAIKY